MKKRLAIIVAVAALASSWGSSAYALSISDANLVGLVIDAVPFGDAERVTYANNLLSLDAPDDQVMGGERYIKYNDFGSGSVSATGKLDGTGVATVSGYEYVLVKYDGPNAGAVLLYLNGGTITLEAVDSGIFRIAQGITGTGCEKDGNCGISGWTAYNYVPDGGSTAVLLGSALLGVGMLRRRFGRS